MIIDHQIEQTESGWICTVCLHTWKKEPSGYDRQYCSGLPYYRKWDQVPEHLKTKTQLRGMRLRPLGEVRARVRGRDGYYDLFDQAETVPMRQASEKQRAVLAAGRKLAGTMICPGCHERVDKREVSRRGICYGCHAQIEQEEFAAAHREARDDSIQWARKMLKVDSVILDTETTGLDGTEVIQIAVIDKQGRTLLETLVKPTIPIPADATAIHGITDEMVASAPGWNTVYIDLLRAVNGRIIVTYNADFDHGAIISTCNTTWGLAMDHPGLPNNWQCAMINYARYFGEWSDYFGDWKYQRLEGGDHSALGDCRATLSVIRRMAEAKLSSEETEETL